MSVRKVKGGRYEVSFYYTHPITGEKQRFRRWSPYTSKRRAKKWEAEQLRKLTDRNYWLEKEEQEARAGIPTLGEFKETFIEAITQHPDYSDGTVKNYESKLRNHVVPALGGQRLDSIETTEVNRLLRRKRAELADNTVRAVCTALGSLLSFAEQEGVIPRGARPEINGPPMPRHQDQESNYLTDEQLDQLIECAHDRVKNMIRIAVRTGLRQGELLGLVWEDVDRKRMVLKVRRQYTATASTNPSDMPPPKSGRPRDVPLTQETMRLFDEHRETPWAGETFVFSFKELPALEPSSPPESEGSSLEPVHINRLRSPIDTAFAKAELPDSHRGWHCLRHTYAARLATKGVSLRLIQSLLGHASVETTERYADLLPEAHEIARRHLADLGM